MYLHKTDFMFKISWDEKHFGIIFTYQQVLSAKFSWKYVIKPHYEVSIEYSTTSVNLSIIFSKNNG